MKELLLRDPRFLSLVGSDKPSVAFLAGCLLALRDGGLLAQCKFICATGLAQVVSAQLLDATVGLSSSDERSTRDTDACWTKLIAHTASNEPDLFVTNVLLPLRDFCLSSQDGEWWKCAIKSPKQYLTTTSPMTVAQLLRTRFHNRGLRDFVSSVSSDCVAPVLLFNSAFLNDDASRVLPVPGTANAEDLQPSVQCIGNILAAGATPTAYRYDTPVKMDSHVSVLSGLKVDPLGVGARRGVFAHELPVIVLDGFTGTATCSESHPSTQALVQVQANVLDDEKDGSQPRKRNEILRMMPTDDVKEHVRDSESLEACLRESYSLHAMKSAEFYDMVNYGDMLTRVKLLRQRPQNLFYSQTEEWRAGPDRFGILGLKDWRELGGAV